ncbi:hypothetical protein BDW02DRAFT_570137 [Decorospora gaudefroyi]|uniref:RRM domain-containing protein n=1 Tax=Decorospora gaudefroyi TaxID=184978 RepID=A0A6A5KC09_9PLEO|nr:hypothetical protein BDW02DRAFT_570137 [Decorospora gaudefroyi]
MAVPRVLSRGRCFLHRSTPSPVRVCLSAVPSPRTPLSKRHFTSSVPVWEDIVQTPSRGPEIALSDARVPQTERNASSICLFKLPKRMTKSELQELVQSKGFNIKETLLRLDRFTFHSDTRCVMQLGSKEEATEAVRQLNETELHGHTINVMPVKEDFYWEDTTFMSQDTIEANRYFYDKGNGAYEGLRPLLEGRRVMLAVQTPGWTSDIVSVQTNNARRIIKEYIGKYGIEALGFMRPFFGDRKQQPRMLCFIDFTTKEGTEKAIEDLHETEIEGRPVWLTLSEPAPWRLYQFAKVAPQLIADLQEKGVFSKEMHEDRFANPLPKKPSKKPSKKVSEEA